MNKYENIIGKILDGRYKILEPVGVGGMAFVLKAEDLVMNRVVAVKILNEQYNGDEEAEKRFINESKAVAMLSNQNIVSVYDVAIYPDIKYIVMEYLDGITLRTYMDNKKVLPWKEACVYTLQILRALEHAHSKNVIHRDIKPQNIMLMKDGCVKVTDFGIAKTPDMSDASSDEKAIGTVYYISPEQASGQETSYASDLYSVGVLFYEMLTGQLPFTADSAVTIAMMQINDTPKDVEELNPTVPYGVAQIVRKAMQKQPEKRFEDAHAMLKAVDYVIKHPEVVFYEDGEEHDPEDVDSVNIGMINTGEIGEYVIKLEEDKKAEEDGESKRQKRKKERKRERKEHPSHSIFPVITGVFLAFLVVALLLGAYLAIKWIPTLFASEEQEDFEVRNLVEMIYTSELRNELEKSNYVLTVKESYQPGVKFNMIIKQDPAAGRKRFADGKCRMTLWVNKYPEDLTVPDVRYMSVADAEAVFRNLRIATKINRVLDKYANDNQVVSTNPAVGSYINPETTVTLNVCYSEEIVDAKTTPNVVGLKVEAAIKNLEESFYLVTIEYRESEQADGTVLEQSVPPHTMGLAAWTTVKLTVSHYVESKKVQDYRGKTLQEAQSMMEFDGLIRGSVKYEPSLLYPKGTVIRQSIEPGTSVLPGTVIDLVLCGEGKQYALEVPDVRNKTLDEGRAMLEEAGYNVTVQRRVAENTTPGIIIAQSLQSGATGYEVGTNITITVSVAKDSVLVGNYKGYTFVQLLTALRQNGLVPGRVTFSADYEGFNQFDVVDQGTPEGEYLLQGAPLDITLYGTEQPADEVPDVVGMDEEQAIRALENAWYYVKVEKVNAFGNDGEVLEQSLADGEQHPAGTVVTIKVCVQQTAAVVPDLTGKTLDEVMDLLDEARLSLGELNYAPSDEISGTVIEQYPAPYSHVDFYTEIDITLAE